MRTNSNPILAGVAALCLLAIAPTLATAQPAAPSTCAGVTSQPLTLPGAASFTYEAASGRDLRLHVLPTPAAGARHPAILFFFGGGWRNGSVAAFEGQARRLTDHGMVAVLADYRVKCRDGTSPADATADARAAYAWVRAHAAALNIDPGKIVLSGGSSGGHLAAVTAMLAPAGEKPAALVLFNPAVDLVYIAPFIGLTPAQATAISPSVLPIDQLPPTLIFHGQVDHTVPIRTVRDFCARAVAAGRPCELHEYPSQDHGFYHNHAIDPVIGKSPYDDTLDRALAFLRALKLAD